MLTKPRPALSEQKEDALWKRRAKDVINENLGKTSRWRALWNYLKRLWSPRKESGSSAGEGVSQEHSGGLSGPADADAPAAERPAGKAEQRKRKFSMADVENLSIEDAEKLTAQVLDLIVKSPPLQDAYEKRQLPVLERLLEKTDPTKAGAKTAAEGGERVAPKEAEPGSREPSADAAKKYERGPVPKVGDLGAPQRSRNDLTVAREPTPGPESAADFAFLSGATLVASQLRESLEFLERNGPERTRTGTLGDGGSQEPVSPVSERSRSVSRSPSQKRR
ncbi:hypothetical protein ACFWP7_09435 [Streptomyces sp. NPDC058470]|uniref:hypothetical protein n=1 Tax=Streptomyces sp. NPDC058470 TaxID=3346515 RepID=UPI00364CF03B